MTPIVTRDHIPGKPIWNIHSNDPRNMIGWNVTHDERRTKLMLAVRVGNNTNDFYEIRSD